MRLAISTHLRASRALSYTRLENQALGKQDFALTRDEYEAASRAQGFQNRFALVGEME